MINQIIISLAMLFGYIGVIFLSEFVYKKFKVDPEYTRKSSHVVSSLSCTVFLLFIESHWYVLFLGVFFFLLLFLGRKYRLFDSIDAVKRKTGGSYLFPIAIYLVFLMSDILDEKLYFILPLIILGISDAIAGTMGSVYSHKTRNIFIGSYSLEKTYLGSLSFLVSSFIISVIVLYFFGMGSINLLIWSLLIAIFSTLTEALSSKGSDNLTVPLVIAFMIWLMLNVF